jgi:predicted Zn-dependent protease with MMP-like domain
MLDEQEFERLVEEGIETIPAKFLRLLNNVAVVVEEAPTAAQLRRSGLGARYTLLGLYEGIPQTRRAHYGVGPTAPDRITIFRRPIEAAAGGNPARVRNIVRDTVWHEIAHHFGLGEERVRRSEARRRGRL